MCLATSRGGHPDQGDPVRPQGFDDLVGISLEDGLASAGNHLLDPERRVDMLADEFPDHVH